MAFRSWSDISAARTVPAVEQEDHSAERAAFRRRLGTNIARIRSTLTEYTQASIAEELGVDTETVGRWERGDREPKVYDLARLARAYDVPADWLLEPTDSITELDARIRFLRQAVEGVGRAVEEEAARRPSANGKPAQHGTSPKRTQPRSRQPRRGR